MSVNGEVVLITGGASGLGLALAQRFVEEGAGVSILDRHPGRLDQVRNTLGEKVLVCEGDVSHAKDNQRAVVSTLERFGRLDCFIANAGVFDFFTPLQDYDDESLSRAFDELFAVNVKGALLGMHAALPALRASRGNVIFTQSNAAFYPAGGGPLYTASKHALTGLVRQLAYELAPQVRVNGVAPGGMRTGLSGLASNGTAQSSLQDMEGFEELVKSVTPLALAPKPADYCGPYLLLASRRDAAPMTGVIINTDGGLGVRGLSSANGSGA